MKNLTKLILESDQKLKPKYLIKIPALIASIFSVLFSLSIVLELKDIVNPIVFIFLAIFTILFLIFNESIKLREIKKSFKGNKLSIIIFLFTFFISVSLSGIGIYFWTNNSHEVKNENKLSLVNKTTEIESLFLNKINYIQNQTFEETNQYKSLIKDLSYWKNKSSATLNERTNIRKYIMFIESKIESNRITFNKDKLIKINDLNQLKQSKLNEIETLYTVNINQSNHNNLISYIFLIMILITEIAIILLNIDIVKFEIEVNKFIDSKMARNYLITRKVLTSLYLTQSKNNQVSLIMALMSPVLVKLDWNQDKKWNEVKKLYNLFISLGILSGGTVVTENGKKNLINNIVMTENEAYQKFDSYFNQLLTQ